MQGIECLSKRNAEKVMEHRNEIFKEVMKYAEKSELSNSWNLDEYFEESIDVEQLARIVEKAKTSDDPHTAVYEITDDYMESSMDFIGEVSHESVSDFLGDIYNAEALFEIIEDVAGLNVSDEERSCATNHIQFLLDDIDPDIYSELHMIVEDAMRFDISELFNYPVLLKLNPTEDFCSECGEDDDIEYYRFIRELSRKYGIEIPKKVATTVYVNSFNESTFGLAIIVDGSELVDFILGNEEELEGDAILYGHDAWSGSGYYEDLAEIITIRSKNDILGIDYGSHSLGDIFGRVEWNY